MARSTSPGTSSTPSALRNHRGRMRLALLRDLAMGEWSYAELAKSLGVTTRDVRAFAEEHAEEVAEVSQALAGRLALETAGLWVSRKQNRVAELQAAFEDNDAVIARMREGAEGGLGTRRHYNLVRLQLSILGAVASEYEPRKTAPQAQADGAVVHYIIEGPDTEALS